MYVANLQQVFKIDPQREAPFSSWILLLCQKSGTKIEKIIRSKHSDIEPELRGQNVNYSEITAPDGKQLVYKKFGCKAATTIKEWTHPPPRNGPSLPVFRNQEGTGLETHLFRHPFSLSIIVFSVWKRRKRWESTGSLTKGHVEYAGNGLPRILALVIARKHAGKKRA